MSLIKTIFLSMLPISEVRGAIPYGLYTGLDFTSVFLFSILGNILIVPIFFIFLDTLHFRLIKIKTYNYLFEKWVRRTRRKIESKIGTKWELPTLFLFVAIPFPLTGAYTGTLAAWLFKINRIKAILTISLGVIIAALVVSLIYYGIISF